MNKKDYRYKCDGCGACCVVYSVLVYERDINREPRLRDVIGRISLEMVPEDGRKREWISGGEEYGGCPLLTNHGSCSIYATRPDVCVRFRPGGMMCQYARGKVGLGLLPAEAE